MSADLPGPAMSAGAHGSANEDTLRPCPFCGGRKLEVALYNRPRVVCQTCDADGPGAQRLSVARDNQSTAMREAKRLWNRRTNESDSPNESSSATAEAQAHSLRKQDA